MKKKPNLSPPTQKQAFTFDRVAMDLQMRFDPLPGLTPEKLASRLREFSQGFLGPMARTMDRMETLDDTLQCVAPKRKTGLAKYIPQVLTIPNLPYGKTREAEKHKEALEYFYNNLTCTSAVEQNARRGFSYLTETMLDALGKKYSVHNIIWEPTEDGITAEFVHGPLWFFENRTGKLRFLETNEAWDGVPMEDGEWLVTVGQGVMQACAVAYMYKRLPLRDWLIYSQDFGRPPIEGVTDEPLDSAGWNQVVDAVRSFAADQRIVRNRSSEIVVHDPIGGSGELPHPKLVERMDRAIAALWRGADLSTMSAGDGDGAGASLQGEEVYNLECSDAKLVSETLNAQVDKFVIEYLFGPGTKPLAYLNIIIPPKQNITQDIQIDEFLLRNNAKLGEEETLERYGRSLPDEDDELLGDSKRETRNAEKKKADAEAANEKSPQDIDEKLISAALKQAREVRPKWLAPLPVFFRELAQSVQDLGSDDDVLAYLEGKAVRVPELVIGMDRDALAKVLEAAMGSAVVAGIENSLHQTEAVNELSFTTPTALVDAIELLDAKTPVGSILRSRDWQRIPLALRQRAQFSSGVESVKLLQRIQEYLEQMISLERNAQRADGTSPGVYKMNRQKFIADIRELALQEGLLPDDDFKIGTLQDITSEARLDLIFRTQMGQAQGYAYWKRGQNTDVLDGWPAQELIRVRHSKVPRDWEERWMNAGGIFRKGKMAALKTDPIWTDISAFGTPWPPFDFNSGMGLRELDREAAVDLGLIAPDQLLEPQVEDFNDSLEASAKNLSPKMKSALATLFGDQIEFDEFEDVVRWKNIREGANENPYHDELGRFTSGPGKKIGEVLSGKTHEASYADVTADEAAKIKSAIGADVTGFQHFIDRDALIHIQRQHGVGRERQPGHSPVTRDDIEKIPDIVSHPDAVVDGGKSSLGLPTIKYRKDYGDSTYYVEEVWTKERKLAAKTMWKKKKMR